MLGRATPLLSLACLIASLLPGLTAGVQAQTRAPDVSQELKLFESTERGLDPLGLDPGTGQQLDEAAKRLEAARQKAAAPKPLVATRGEVLTSVDGVQEAGHAVRVQLAQGLAFVALELRFESRVAQPAEVSYRLPLAAGAAPYAFEVCQGARCSKARPDATAPRALPNANAQEPWAHAERIDDARGPALCLRAGPVLRGQPLLLRLRYVAPAALHAGVARFRLPARGYDPRLAAAEVTLDAPGLVDLTPAGSVTLEPNLGLELTARLDPARAPKRVETHAQCGGRPCARSFEAALPRPVPARETWLLLDTSPSMEGPARNAADTALAGLLALLPEETPLRVIAFGASAREVGRFEAAGAPLALLSDALALDLGASSRPGRALDLAKADLARVRPRVLVLSDGKLDKEAVHELAPLRRLASELWWIALSLEPSLLEPLCDGVVRSAETQEREASESLLAAALAPRVKPGLWAGEQRVRETAARQAFTPRADEDWLSFWLARAEPLAFRTPFEAAPSAVRAPAFVAREPSAPRPDTGMPKESVLSMLRNQLVPQARGCLRSDRKGRGDYAVALTFNALFADREAYDVRVEGAIPDALRKCLSDVVPRLRVPAFSGRIRVRYPIHTEREPESPVIELEGEALRHVERVIGDAGPHGFERAAETSSIGERSSGK